MLRTALSCTLALALFACDDKPKPETTTPVAAAKPQETRETTAPTSGTPLVASAIESTAEGITSRTWQGDHFDVKVVAKPCKAKTECQAEIQLTAKEGFHINDEYPYKFTAKDAEGITFKGKDTPETFSKAAGDFRKNSELDATLQMRFEADGTGKLVPLSGTFKMSVCSAQACQIETPSLEMPVPLSS